MFNRRDKYVITRIESNWENTMHMFGRYDDEIHQLTFEYEKITPCGKGFSQEQIFPNCLEIQSIIINDPLFFGIPIEPQKQL